MPDDHRVEEVLSIITTLGRKASGGGYIFRGEPMHYYRVASRLYREFEHLGDFDVEDLQNQMLNEAKDYIQRSMLDEAGDYADKPDRAILAQLQHYGGGTNLIDFTTDYLVALFFACDGFPDENGRVVLLEVSQEMIDYEHIWVPRAPVNRVFAQKSVFVEVPRGFVEPDDVVNIPKGLKVAVLEYLSNGHDIFAPTIYNDLHGFIRYRALHHDAFVSFSAGLTCHNEGDYQGAIDYYTNALELNPRHAIAYNNRGLSYHKKGDYSRAIQDYTRAIDLNPNYALAYCNRGEAYLHLGEWENARADLTAAMKLGYDIVDSFQEDYESVAAFEQQHSIQLPPDLAEMLGS